MTTDPPSHPTDPSPVAVGPLDGNSVESAVDPAVPLPARRRDMVLPLLVAVSLVAHIAIVAPSLFRRDPVADSAQEVPVEIVQLPPDPPKPAPKPATPKPEPPKPQPPKPAPQPEPQKPAPPKQAAKPEPAKPEPAKPPPKAEPPKPAPQKPAPTKPTPANSKAGAGPGTESEPSGTDRYKSLIGAMPAMALPGSSPDGTDEVSYSQLVLSRVAKAKKEGRFRGMPGATSVAFTIDDQGGLAKVEIVRPSGIPDLDTEAIAMIRRGAPYPPPPPGGRRDYTITLRFQPLI